MTPNDFIYDQVYRGGLSSGASERCAKDAAVMTLDKFKKGRLGGNRASRLIE